jgi:DNA mismatch repair protein MutS
MEHLVTMTPLMRQYHEIKSQYKDALVFFQVGDFYELFFEDAKKASAFLGLTLTSRGMQDNEPIPLCGVPVHTLHHYLIKLIKGGFRLVVCDQLEIAQPGKIVQRGVKQVFTPGTLIDESLLDAQSASYLAVIFPITNGMHLAFVELLTGNLIVTQVANDLPLIEAELARFSPDEVLIPATKLGHQYQAYIQHYGYVTTLIAYDANDDATIGFHDWRNNIKGLPITFDEQMLTLLYSYLRKNHPHALALLTTCLPYRPDQFLLLDASTQRNLEIVANSYDRTRNNSLLSILDKSVTAMGSRTIKKWLLRPLIEQKRIEQRLDAVMYIKDNHAFREQLRVVCGRFGDIERMVGRIALRRNQVRDYQSLMTSLTHVPALYDLIHNVKELAFCTVFTERLADFSTLYDFLCQSLNDDTTKEWRIKKGFHAELDRLRLLVDDGARALCELERKEQVATGIASLKIRYNRTQGYGIEVTKPNIHLVPSYYVRSQSLLNRERFVTQELKDLEYDLVRAQGAIEELETTLFIEITRKVENYIPSLRVLAHSVAYLDAFAAFAECAVEYGYTRPLFNGNRDIRIKAGRHPVVERTRLGASARGTSAQGASVPFIANDTMLTDNESLWIITGPNMGGKSTYLRQVALMCIMAQSGSFVPADEAFLAIIDRIFTRIGAADRVFEGKSTFLVEMEETALICSYATPHSLVILDEVGRGTSTYDGLAIAQAVVEYISQQLKARCLFATHYHELTQVAARIPGTSCYYVASKKTADGIVLLHTLVHGITDGSFGIETARRAGLPPVLIERASAILEHLKAARQPESKSSV